MEQRPPRDAGLLATVRAVLWSFVGVRRSDDYRRDALRLKPRNVVLVGLIAGLLFVLILVLVVRLIVAVATPA